MDRGVWQATVHGITESQTTNNTKSQLMNKQQQQQQQYI